MESLFQPLRSGFWDDKSLSRGRIAPVRFATFTNTSELRLPRDPTEPRSDIAVSLSADGTRGTRTMRFSGQKVSGVVSHHYPDDGSYDILYDDFDAWIFSTCIQPGAWAYVCTRGARVALNISQNKQTNKSKSNAIPVQCGTVVGLTKEGMYQVRLDNCDPADAIVNVDLRPDNVLPEARHQYKAGQKLTALCPVYPENSSPVWTDCEVIAYLGPEHGSRHRVRFSNLKVVEMDLPNWKVVEMDLNRFNHSTAKFSTAKFLQLREEYCRHLVGIRHEVVDAITGRALDISKQTVNIRTVSISGRDGGNRGGGRGMVDLAHSHFNIPMESARLQGKVDACPILIKAMAGKGKTWGVQQLEYHLATLGTGTVARSR